MTGNRMRVLLIEDDLDMARLMTTVLRRESRGQIEPVDAGRLADGLRLVEQEQFDVVLLELEPAGQQGAGHPDGADRARARFAHRGPERPGR